MRSGCSTALVCRHCHFASCPFQLRPSPSPPPSAAARNRTVNDAKRRAAARNRPSCAPPPFAPRGTSRTPDPVRKGVRSPARQPISSAGDGEHAMARSPAPAHPPPPSPARESPHAARQEWTVGVLPCFTTPRGFSRSAVIRVQTPPSAPPRGPPPADTTALRPSRHAR